MIKKPLNSHLNIIILVLNFLISPFTFYDSSTSSSDSHIGELFQSFSRFLHFLSIFAKISSCGFPNKETLAASPSSSLSKKRSLPNLDSMALPLRLLRISKTLKILLSDHHMKEFFPITKSHTPLKMNISLMVILISYPTMDWKFHAYLY